MNRSRLPFLGVSLLLVAGCGGDGRPERLPVSGVVVIDGEPLTHGFVQVTPTGQRAAHGKIGPDGTFQLTTFEENDGCVPGRHAVAIIATESINASSQRWHAPKKYMSNKTSGLEIDVKADGPTDDVRIELTWDGGKPFVESWAGE